MCVFAGISSALLKLAELQGYGPSDAADADASAGGDADLDDRSLCDDSVVGGVSSAGGCGEGCTCALSADPGAIETSEATYTHSERLLAHRRQVGRARSQPTLNLRQRWQAWMGRTVAAPLAGITGGIKTARGGSRGFASIALYSDGLEFPRVTQAQNPLFMGGSGMRSGPCALCAADRIGRQFRGGPNPRPNCAQSPAQGCSWGA